MNVSNRTLVRVMNENGYKSSRLGQNGLVSVKETERRARFNQTALKQYNSEYWANVLLHLDEVSFIHKHNPYNRALTARGKI